MSVLAIDASLTSTGVAYRRDAVVTKAIQCKTRVAPIRLAYIRDAVSKALDEVSPELVVLEGYAMGIRSGRLFDIGELGGVLKLCIWERGLPLLVIPPTNLKKFTTGKGNAKKPDMAAALYAQDGVKFRTDDEADAYALLLMGEAYLNSRLLPRDRRHYKHSALSGVSILRGRF